VLGATAARLATNRAFASAQMGFSLGWHVVLASFGVGFPLLVLYAEWRGQRSRDPVYAELARRWSKVLGVLFAVGAVSGTILSFELGILWPGLMGRFGSVFGFPFSLEGFAFFVEAIFLGIYLYGWDRVSPRAHLASGVPIALAGLASAWFVVTANSWMNDPTGFRLVHGKVTDVSPWAGMLNPATPTETVHMLAAAYMVTGFGVASVYAVAQLRGRTGRYHATGMRLGLAMGAVLAPLQGVVGDLSARYVASHQPVKLAAMEAVFHTSRGVPESLGGIASGGRLHLAVSIPDGLSLLTHFDPNSTVTGLDAAPAGSRPPVNPVHLSFDAMVLIGLYLFFVALWSAWAWWRRRSLPGTRPHLVALVAAGPLAVAALEAGWVATEVGRQPWIVYRVMRVSEAVSPAPGLWVGLPVLLVVYAALTAVLLVVLRRLAATEAPGAQAAAPGSGREADLREAGP
jgi:cytochrome d ubiquinol oxidase subunit I